MAIWGHFAVNSHPNVASPLYLDANSFSEAPAGAAEDLPRPIAPFLHPCAPAPLCRAAQRDPADHAGDAHHAQHPGLFQDAGPASGPFRLVCNMHAPQQRACQPCRTALLAGEVAKLQGSLGPDGSGGGAGAHLSFLLVLYCDLKRHRFYHWCCFPTLAPAQVRLRLPT